jgi:hypothetical protein
MALPSGGKAKRTQVGGYCQHGNILFPVWHRAYMLAFEDALRTVKPNVTLPFLDETCETARTQGLPWVLTRRKFTFKHGEEIDNPLFSYKLPVAIVDKTVGAGPSHSKPVGYETRRYFPPFTPPCYPTSVPSPCFFAFSCLISCSSLIFSFPFYAGLIGTEGDCIKHRTASVFLTTALPVLFLLLSFSSFLFFC